MPFGSFVNIDNTGDPVRCFNQISAQMVWTVNHNLGYHPLVQVFDSAGTQLAPCVTRIDQNTFTVTHGTTMSGKVYYR